MSYLSPISSAKGRNHSRCAVPKGFTLVEVVVVLVILGILVALAIPRYIDLDSRARQRAIDNGIAELNGREKLVWSNFKSSKSGYPGDLQVFATVDTYLGPKYIWTVGPLPTGGNLKFSSGGQEVVLQRSPSTNEYPAYWSRSTGGSSQGTGGGGTGGGTGGGGGGDGGTGGGGGGHEEH